MNTKKTKSLTYILSLAVIALSTTTSCKKDKETPSRSDIERVEKITDSIFLYAKEAYLWNTSLPTYEVFNPRQYVQSDEEAGFNAELLKITKYPINPSTGVSYEEVAKYPSETKYSFISNTDNDNPIAFVGNAKSSVDLEGNGYDLGIDIKLYGTETNFDVFVTDVARNSPAEKAGIMRGDEITSINGTAVGNNFDAQEDLLNNTFYNDKVTPATLKGIKRDGSALSAVLSVSSYKGNPISKDTIYTAGAKKIGYMAYSSFTTLDKNSKPVLDAVFSKFATAGVTDLIIDLRYNGGGYVTTAQYLANLIAPISIDNSVMFSEHYNKNMQDKNIPLLSKKPYLNDDNTIRYSGGKMVTYADIPYSVAENTILFDKQGLLNNIRNVVFIVSSSTASASELVINSLKPYMNVQLVGEQTYGKPVGFFPIKIDKYDVYLSMFESRNKNDEADYYQGFTPDEPASDNVSYLLGDRNENSINAAYKYLVNGAFPGISSSSTSSIKTSRGAILKPFTEANKKLPAKGFRGMIEDRIKTK
ncbi:S41 family peptidase [Arcticibacter eurypsychrophilus]|uniref:S41 family peptidase n=1 Tax=Arcticibacter eurypsychrophilus TaxID=1434752 RepID=UPI00084DFC16|nr:S41 family peptidase [Arcticibacter eurypsychrophilus]